MSKSIKQEAMEYLLNRLDEIDNNYDTLTAKSSQWRKAVNKVKRDLRQEDSKGKLGISLNTYHSYLGDLRTAVKRTNRKHPALTSDLTRKGYMNKVVQQLPDYEADLKQIANMSALTIHKGVTALKEQIKADLNGTPRNKAVAALKSLLIHHPVVMMLEKEDAEKEDRAEDRAKSLEKKTLNKKIYNAPALIEKAISLLYDESYTARAWALALLTGRRSVEVIYHAEFERLTESTVMFSGQAKKSVGTPDKPYPIPVLADSQTIVDALKAFRDLPPVKIFKTGRGSFDWHEDVKYSDLSTRDLNKAINQRVSGVLNDRARNIVGDKAEVFKNTRIIYAEYCKQHMRDLTPEWATMADDAYLRAILGHDQLGEVKHYNQAQVLNESGAEWLKVPEPTEENDSEPQEEAKAATKNWKATNAITSRNLADDIEENTPELVPVGGRNVRGKAVKDFHKRLRVWAAENPTMGITQSAIEKNKGNTHTSGTGTVDVRANRGTFQAWLQVVGKDAVSEYNKQAQQRRDKAK